MWVPEAAGSQICVTAKARRGSGLWLSSGSWFNGISRAVFPIFAMLLQAFPAGRQTVSCSDLDCIFSSCRFNPRKGSKTRK